MLGGAHLSAAKALSWLRTHELPTGGIRVHSRHANAYPEVSGYLMPTLLACGERDLALRTLRWLVCIQRADGSFTDADGGRSYVFDAGQVLRGLLSGMDLLPQAREAAVRAAEYLVAQAVEDGAGGFGPRYSGEIPEAVHLYALPPLVEAAERLGEPRFREVAERCLNHYTKHRDFLDPEVLTHFLAYQLEALIDLGRADLARPVLDRLEGLQARDGSVRGRGGVRWTCSPGLAQLAICWYKVKRPGPADRAVAWLESHQEASGGLLGSYGRRAAYFPDEELSWAAKFYLDAHLLRTASFFELNAKIFPAEVARDDGRAQALLQMVRPGDRVLEAGCGKGRFLKLICDAVPRSQCTGVDISPALLTSVPEGIETVHGALENLPCPDGSFDVAFSVEAIEHSVNPEAAVAELVRVARPGGWVIIIDKHQGQWGRMKCPPWERWPEIDRMRALLNRGCDEVAVEPVGYGKKPASDGLMVCWRGRKRGALSGEQWNQVLLGEDGAQALVVSIKANRIPPWGQTVMLATAPGDRVLEVGSGTGQISLHLALGGRRTTLLDSSPASLASALDCARRLGLTIETVQADATQTLPFVDGRFECVWSSGLLEHFPRDERRRMLRDWARLASRTVIALVPNAHCLAYRAGKAVQEAAGTWKYGQESPLPSLRDDFEAAGLEVVSEFTVGAGHALNFLPANHQLRQALSEWLGTIGAEAAEDAGQGYLLCTTGKPRRP